MLTRDSAIQLIAATTPDSIMARHILLVEAIMRALAADLKEDLDAWGITGLLHDYDFRETSSNLEMHGQRSVELLRGKGLPEASLLAIERHNYTRALERTSMIDKALLASDMAAGLVNAAAAVMPGRNVALLELKSLVKRFKNDKFAPGSKREYMVEFAPSVGGIDRLLMLVLDAAKHCSEQPSPFQTP